MPLSYLVLSCITLTYLLTYTLPCLPGLLTLLWKSSGVTATATRI